MDNQRSDLESTRTPNLSLSPELLRQMGEIQERLSLPPQVRDQLSKIHESLRIPSEAMQHMEQIREQLAPIIEGAQRFSEQIREAFKIAIPEGYKFPSWEEQEAAYRERLKMLATHGWYAAMDFPLATLNRADAAFRENREGEANEGLTALFDRDAPKIIRAVTEEFPETSALLTRALRAHQEGDFIVSVMILLSQAEGIWVRHANSLSPYSKCRKNKKALREAIKSDSVQTPIRAYWELLLEEIPIKSDFHHGDPIPAVLNRHAVMHGASLDFGTKSNSARAFSWLSYVAEIRGYFGLVKKESEPSDERLASRRYFGSAKTCTSYPMPSRAKGRHP